eukprot:6793152-Pyramimonas_sp.AAC.1
MKTAKTAPARLTRKEEPERLGTRDTHAQGEARTTRTTTRGPNDSPQEDPERLTHTEKPERLPLDQEARTTHASKKPNDSHKEDPERP